MTPARSVLAALWLVAAGVLAAQVAFGQAARGAVPLVVVVETARGTFAFQLFSDDAPASVAHVVALVKQGFYDGMRVHRALPGFLVQFGDPQTRDDAKRALWGRGVEAGSGHAVGAAEISAKRLHQTGTVGLAHRDPAGADSQLYITLAPRRDLDGRYAVVGQVIEGADVLPRLQVEDEIRRAYLRP
jgi:peptidyl-prolyl cis-trans isomerase B (cyclophilin B)